MTVKIGKTTIDVIQGDIVEQPVEAIVNAANDHLWMGGGVAGAIKRRGGDIIETEAIKQGPIQTGTVVVTSGGALPAQRVIHAAVMGQDLQTNADIIARATRAILQRTEDDGFVSVAIPALGTSVGGFSMQHCAKIMIENTIAFFQAKRSITLVRFVLFSDDAQKVFSSELKRVFSAHK